MACPFCCVVPGCAPITQFQQIEETKWATELGVVPESIVVFLTGEQLIPADMALGVYLSRVDTPDGFTYVGHLTNECPSAIFRIPMAFLDVAQGVAVSVGLSLDTLESVHNLGETTAQSHEQFRVLTHLEIARRILAELMKFVFSYAKTGVDPSMGDEEIVYLPASWVAQWKQRIETKMAKDNSFWAASSDT